MPLTFPVVPMTATLGQLPYASEDDRWAYEIKWDGYRTLAFVDDGRVRLQSRGSHDVTATYPEVSELGSGVHASVAVLDTELVVLDSDGRPRFDLVQRHTSQAVLYVFDVLRIEGHDTIGLGYLDRRRLLEQIVEPGDNWTVPGHRVGEGAALFDATEAMNLEGIMAKRIDSIYQPGKRSPDWRKVKHRRRAELTIGGFTRGDGNRSGTFGALLVGQPGNTPDDALAFAGGVGTGFDHATLESLTARLAGLVTNDCPFEPAPPAAYRRNAVWVRPELSALVEFTEFTNDGYVRHASFIDLIDPEVP
ncbi:MAG TPA: non-homologous end-joining DNA ligase [Ilumatobacter sp.]|nr:non-homologous end-joining DNA ligase [Ilumatobacter sp.]